ncbi:unnamed protein product [Ostreobium quekettii]|uniref:Coproporphyrinogen oxidase n=1 Tax=Ostreobium quekettii TaxID=121088 RepID=A0A8S1IV66_9CHLO|nr:unnamed protein product [Ostreobium quekettii]|eukprot:evm.model.scf_210.12 EVM.evm.TU.scf_210.12   scf_210:117575-119573(-)
MPRPQAGSSRPAASLPRGHQPPPPTHSPPFSLRRPAPLPAHSAPRTPDDTFEDFILSLQSSIVERAEALDGHADAKFGRDEWSRGERAGYGVTRVMRCGDLIEKGAVNVSLVRGVLTAERAAAMSSRGRPGVDPAGGQEYAAESLSLVFHPRHPMVPTLRADVRRFRAGGACWYGGGCDLTPCYLFEDDARRFHAHWAAICDASAPNLYPEFKAWCDRYFYLPARQECRGIGGIFFDDLEPGDAFDVEGFVRAVGDGILDSWAPIAEERRRTEFGEPQRRWQLLRRGRYVEFNLLYDRGVRFGLQGGRMESVMVSAPPLVAWDYDVRPEAGSPEARLLDVLKEPRDWLNRGAGTEEGARVRNDM